MDFIWNKVPTANWVIELLVIILVYVTCIFVLAKVVKRSIPICFLAASYAASILTFLFNLIYAFIAVSVFGLCVFLISIFVNLGAFRNFVANPFKKVKAGNAKFVIEKAYDKDAMYKAIETTVINFSRDRIGALITFEKNTSLADIVKNGVPVNAPVSVELLQTIFFPGTRLHDGAVVIHKDNIVAASVFFTPTTKAFAGKYGSRHRAGLGISEISDAVTVIVSEETGRISIAINGELETVEPKNFLRAFENYMDAMPEE